MHRRTVTARTILAAVLLALLPAMAAAQPEGESRLPDLIARWKAGSYASVLKPLLDYRKQPYGRTVLVDYMIATSACRVAEFRQDAEKFFRWILKNYSLSPEHRRTVEEESRLCSSSPAPSLILLSAVRTGSGAVGVRGKTFYWIDQDMPVGADTVEVVRQIPIEELEARRHPPDRAREGMQQMRELAGSGFAVEPAGPFLIASSAGQSADGLRAIGTELAAALRFFTAEFDIPEPRALVNVYLVRDPQELRDLAGRIHGLRISSSSIGYSYQDDLSVLAVIPGRQIGTLKHELFHLLVRSHFGDIPPWLDEGMAALYEVSELRGSRLAGLPNWRGAFLERHRERRTRLAELVAMDWTAFDAPGPDPTPQAVQHATARYFMLYLQEIDRLRHVYNAFRTRNPDDPEAEDAARLLSQALGRPLAEVETAFAQWLPLVLSWELTPQVIQRAEEGLRLLGFDPGPVDGTLDERARQAIREFQTSNGIQATGELDQATYSAIHAMTGKD